MNTELTPKSSQDNTMSAGVNLAVALLRITIGWHFLYEGLAKLLTPNWSATSYLLGSSGPLAGLFRALAANSTAMPFVDQLNIWGLILIGAGLMLGLFTRFAAVSGMALLALYYAANPPLFQPPASAQEGHYLLVNKNIVELIALGVILLLPARRFGLDEWLSSKRRQVALPDAADVPEESVGTEPSIPGQALDRRRFLAWIGLPVAGAFALVALRRHYWRSAEERQLIDAYSGATAKVNAAKRLEDLRGQLPMGQIGNLKLSRMILGGNLIGGWAHARDLIYVSALVQAYHHRGKIFETLSLAEACGVNTILTSPLLCNVIKDYRRTTGGKIQFVSDLGGVGKGVNLSERIKRSIDAGAGACYLHGGISDNMVAKGNFEPFEETLDLVRRNGLPVGFGAHKLKTVQACRDRGLKPDFWMKTLHHGNYWSAHGGEPEKGLVNDNLFCERPDEVIAYMKEVQEPWIAFKTLAAGAIHPRDGFHYAFVNGADFICVGMYDFQIVEDVNIAFTVLNSRLKRQREWRA